jgi:hypothetical protein
MKKKRIMTKMRKKYVKKKYNIFNISYMIVINNIIPNELNIIITKISNKIIINKQKYRIIGNYLIKLIIENTN